MKIDILIEYDDRNIEVTFSSKVAGFSQTRPSWIGLSKQLNGEFDIEQIEFVGEDRKTIMRLKKLWELEPIRNNRRFRIVNPLSPSTFEPKSALKMVKFFSITILSEIYPKTWQLRSNIPLFHSYKITLKVPNYSFFEPKKKEEFEKLMKNQFKQVNYI